MSVESARRDLDELVAAADGSPRSRMKIACHALWLALEIRKPMLSEVEFKREVSTYLDDVLRMGVTFDLEIDGLRPHNPYAARMAELAPVIEALSERIDTLILDPSTPLSELRETIESAVSDPSVQEAQEILSRQSKTSH